MTTNNHLVSRLRQARASMLGTYDQATYIACHEAADLIESMCWVSVDDRLPDSDKPVLTFGFNYDEEPCCDFAVASYHDGIGFYGVIGWLPSGAIGAIGGIDRSLDMKVTHWMPLPKPPLSRGNQ